MKKIILFTALALFVTSGSIFADTDNIEVLITNSDAEQNNTASLTVQSQSPDTSQCPTPKLPPKHFSAQPEYQIQSLWDSTIYAHGGYGGFGMKLTQLDGKMAFMTGGRGAWIVNHSFLIGGGGYGTISNTIKRTFNGEEKDLKMGYGGLDLGYILFSDQLLHLSIQSLIGAGGIGYIDKLQIGTNGNGNDISEYDGKFDAFFVFEPMVYLELNVTSWFRIAAGCGYRFIEGVELAGVNDDALQGSSAELLFKFGSF